MLKLKDNRTELFQWDTNRMLVVEGECSELHFSNQTLGRSIDVEVVNGEARIPDELLQTSNELKVWGFVGSADNGFTKFEQSFIVNERNRPADYIYTPTKPKILSEFRIKDKVDGKVWNLYVSDGKLMMGEVV